MPGDSCPRARPVAGQLLVPGGAAHPLRPVRPVPERDPGAASSTRHVGAEGQISPWAAASSGPWFPALVLRPLFLPHEDTVCAHFLPIV